ncbi:formyltetrahydrofolate deformylase [Magnetococcales bacterium HHB-1]
MDIAQPLQPSPVSDSGHIIFLGHCPDRIGIIREIATFFSQEGVNILRMEQHTERDHFFVRVLGEPSTSFQRDTEGWKTRFYPLAEQLSMEYGFYPMKKKTDIVLFCSKTMHCPLEVLSRWSSGDLNVNILAIVSNHRIIEPAAKRLKIPFFHTPAVKGSLAHEEEQLRILQDIPCDLIVLARYMRILSGNFLKQAQRPIINIHHSFLPSFVGADPYHQAYKRGVKLIGATTHFVIEELDQGPIISQNVIPVNHLFSIPELQKVGSDIEKRELAFAVTKFTEHKIIEWNGRTVVFH